MEPSMQIETPHRDHQKYKFQRKHRQKIDKIRNKKNYWGTSVPRINVENVMKLGFVLE
jgi:hypothetical protein